MQQWFINGKFTAQRLTGVQRYARCLLVALDARPETGSAAAPWTLLVPPGGEPPPLHRIGVRRLPAALAGGRHGWEQTTLARAARRGRLLDLAGSAPAFAGPQACVMHDAAVFDHPEAYAWPFRRWYRWLFARLARRAEPLITVSAFSRARLARALGVPEARFRVVPGGADHLQHVAADETAIAAAGLDRTPFLLAVGSANPTKNLDALVRAWQSLARADARLVIVGGANAGVFADAAHPTAAGVVALGPVDDATLKALYGRAAGLVFPSLYEGFGLPPLEAMACGCPVACSNAASLPEVCGDAALMFDPRDEPAIADAMRRLLDDGALRAALRERGLRHAAAFTWTRSATALLQALGIAA